MGFSMASCWTCSMLVEHLLLVPLIQSVLKYEVKNQNYESNSDNKHLAIGKKFALSLLPFLAAKNPDATQALECNMILSANLQPVFEGSQAVADARLPMMQDLGALEILPSSILSITAICGIVWRRVAVAAGS
eukprot:scaffold5695_cov38-Attheya_sp.AAC.2